MKYSILCESKFTVSGIGVGKHLFTNNNNILERYDPTSDTCKMQSSCVTNGRSFSFISSCTYHATRYLTLIHPLLIQILTCILLFPIL